MNSLPIHKFIPGQMLLVLDYLGLLVVLDYIEIRMKHTVLVLATHELNFITPITNPPPPFYVFLSTYLFCTVDMNCTRTCKCFKRTLISFFPSYFIMQNILLLREYIQWKHSPQYKIIKYHICMQIYSFITTLVKTELPPIQFKL